MKNIFSGDYLPMCEERADVRGIQTKVRWRRRWWGRVMARVYMNYL